MVNYMIIKKMLLCVIVLFSASINAQTINDAVQAGDLQKIKEFVETDPALVNFLSEDNEAPLHLAAFMGLTEIAQYLIDNKADINIKGRQGCTPLHYASYGNQVDLVKLLINEVVNPDILSERSYTPLHFAAMRPSPDAIAILIKMGASINAQDVEGNTPLHLSAVTGLSASTDILIENNADYNIQNNLGQKPLHLASMAEDPGAAISLIKKGADVNSLTSEMDTPLHSAVYQANIKLVKLLLSKGADVNAKNNNGNTPLDYALKRNHEDLVKLLKSNGGMKNNFTETQMKEKELDTTKDGLTSPVKFQILYDNYVAVEGTKAQWGFSCLIRGTEKEILFDTGTLPDILEQNITKLNVDVSKIQQVVLSHNHSDHTGGLLWFLDHNSDVDLYLPDSFPYDFIRKTERYNINIHTNLDPVEICDNVYLTGELGDRIKEQSLIINKKEGLIIVTGCSHPGIVNILKRAKELFDKKILLVFGGFHLMNHSEKQLENVITEFKSIGVEKCGATHCTGEKAISAFKAAFGDNYVEMGTGREIIVP